MNEMLFSKLKINHDISIEQYNVLTILSQYSVGCEYNYNN